MILSIPIRQGDMLTLLTQVSNRLKDEVEGVSAMSPLLTQELIGLTAAYASALQTLTTQRSTKAILALAKATRLRSLIQLIRDFRAVHQRRVNREPDGQRLDNLFVGLSDLPSVSQSNARQWLYLGQQLVTAEAEAIRQGFEPSTNPSIAELEALMAGSEQLFAATDEACFELKEAQIRLAELHQEVGPKLRLLGANLRHRFRNHAKPEIRALMRTYGFAYKAKGNGQESPEPIQASPEPDPSPKKGWAIRQDCQEAEPKSQKEPKEPRPTDKQDHPRPRLALGARFRRGTQAKITTPRLKKGRHQVHHKPKRRAAPRYLNHTRNPRLESMEGAENEPISSLAGPAAGLSCSLTTAP